MSISNSLNAIAVQYQSSDTILVVSTNIFSQLETELPASSASLASSAMTWSGVSLQHAKVFADSRLQDNEVAVFTNGNPKSVLNYLRSSSAYVLTPASFPQ